MKKKLSKKIIVLVFITICIVPLWVWAINTVATGYKTTTTDRKVNAHWICNEVKHTGWTAYFVPTKTSAEWAAVRSNSPSWLAISTCCTTIPAHTIDIRSSCANWWRVPANCPWWYTQTDYYNGWDLDCRWETVSWESHYTTTVRECTRAASTVCGTSQCTTYAAHSYTRTDQCGSGVDHLQCASWYTGVSATDGTCNRNWSTRTRWVRTCSKSSSQICSYN